MIDWSRLSPEDERLLRRITNRAAGMGFERNGLGLRMAISAAHIHCPMDLEKLYGFDEMNFVHDIAGILRHLDPETGELENCFVPRCALPEAAEA